VKHPIPMWGAANSDAFIVQINHPGRIYLANEPLTLDQLTVEIRAHMSQRGESLQKKVYIRADSAAKYEAVKGVLDAIRDAGVEHVGFIVDSW
jgi:biopolymer transport protein ExbD